VLGLKAGVTLKKEIMGKAHERWPDGIIGYTVDSGVVWYIIQHSRDAS